MESATLHFPTSFGGATAKAAPLSLGFRGSVPSPVDAVPTDPSRKEAKTAMRSEPEHGTRQLRDEALAGDSDALAELIDHLTPVIQARLTRLLLRHTSAHPEGQDRREMEDLVQEVFLKLFADKARVLRSWDPDKGASLRNFVGLITERYAISLLRSRHRWVPTDALDPERPDPVSDEATPEGRASSRQSLLQLLDRLRSALSPQGWAVFRLLFVEERSVSDIRDDVGLSADAIYAWRSRLRKMARNFAQDMERSGEPRRAVARRSQ